MEMYTKKQKQAAKIVADKLQQSLLNFHHELNNTTIVLEVSATTNPELKETPSANRGHLENWDNEQNNSIEQNAVLYEKRMLSFDKRHPLGMVREIYEYTLD